MIDHVAFVVDNIADAVGWYVSKTGSKILYQDESWAMLEIFGTKLALVLPGHHPAHFAIKCKSTESFPCDMEEINEHRDSSKYYYLCDPYGNAIEWICYSPDNNET
jgi:extradiol dioxygenase family protein